MMTIKEKQDSTIDDFGQFEEWMDKYEYIIQLGKDLPPMPEEWKKDEYLIKGCQSRVWLYPELKDGILFFHADSDALITKGLVALVVDVLSGQKPEDIAAADIYFIKEIGLDSHLSPTRSNGLLSMLKQMKHYGIAFMNK
jgi:cysteine desulfuration protein SufE